MVIPSLSACPAPRAALGPLVAAAGDVNAFTLHQFVNGLIVTACLCAIPIAVFAILYGRYNSPPVKGPEFLHEPPADLPPAVVDALFTTAPTPAKMVATLLDLVRRDVIVMNKAALPAAGGNQWATRDDHALHLRRDRLPQLSPLERDFCYELFDHIGHGADDVLLSSLREWWQQHPATATVAAGYWGLQVRREAEGRGLLRPDWKGRSRLTLVGMLTMLTPWAMVVLFPGPAGKAIGVAAFATILPLGIVLVAMAQRVTALTDKGRELAGGYEALRRYMETFGHLQDKPPEAVVLWERYLTLAVVLGLAEKTVDELYIMPPSFAEYGAAGRFGRRAYGIPGRARRLPDLGEAMGYGAFRHEHDPTLPSVHLRQGKSDGVFFRPSLGLARRSPFARHGIGTRRLAD